MRSPLRESLPRVEDGGEAVRCRDLIRARAASGGRRAFGDDQGHGLADVIDFVRGQQGLVLDDVADLVLPRNVAGREHGHDAGERGRRRGIEPS